MTLPTRAGPRPATTDCAPHSQTDQLPTPDQRASFAARVRDTFGAGGQVEFGISRRAPPGTLGLYLQADAATQPERCYLLGREFAHHHTTDDGSLHLILPEPLRAEAMAAGWAEPHPMAGLPTVSPDTVMLYAPRDEAEEDIILSLMRRSLENAAS